MKVLVIAAHPDDEVLGCGGTIARLAREGHDVFVAILGEGITSRYQQREKADRDLVEALHARSSQVAEFLGVREVFFYQLPDNRFDTVPLLDVVKIIEELVEKLQPQAVYTQHGGDLNIDHVIVYRATLTALRPMKGTSVKALYAYEVPSSTDWSFAQFEPFFRPSVFFDISVFLDTKVQAMQLYESEAQPFPHPRSPEALRAFARRWGSTVGLEAAEVFVLVWMRD
jgi:LmbE family N-acetylglucosaminyl deacetylase